jgi:Family of unknown function (DUF5519)
MHLSLEEKGPIQAAPVLSGAAESVSVEIQSWPGIISATHWHFHDAKRVDGADFYVGLAELGHIHLSGQAHISTSAGLSAPLLRKGFASRMPWGGEAYASWTLFDIRTPTDAAHAIWLFRLQYDLLQGAAEPDLIAQIEQYQVSGR